VIGVTIPANLILASLNSVNNPKEFENGKHQDSGELEKERIWIDSACECKRLWQRLAYIEYNFDEQGRKLMTVVSTGEFSSELV